MTNPEHFPAIVELLPRQKAAANAHWDRIRKSIPRFAFPARRPEVTIEISTDESRDIERFKTQRTARLNEGGAS